MLKIRLTRRGKKNRAFYRLVVAEHTSPIKGRFLELLGFLDPHTKEKSLKEERIKFWISKGAQCSDSAHNILVSAGVIDGPKRAIKLKKKAQEEKTEEPAKENAAKETEKKEAEVKEAPKSEAKSEEKTEEKGTQADQEKTVVAEPPKE